MAPSNVDIIRNIYRAFNERQLDDIMPWCAEDEDFRFDVERLLDSGDHVAVIGTARAHGASGLDLETDFVHVCRLRDGKVVWGYDCAGVSRNL